MANGSIDLKILYYKNLYGALLTVLSNTFLPHSVFFSIIFAYLHVCINKQSVSMFTKEPVDGMVKTTRLSTSPDRYSLFAQCNIST